jgi:hypothetical protein
MKRERRESFPPTKFYSRNQELIFCKSDWTVWRAYHYKSARCWIHHPFRVQWGSVTWLGTSVMVSRVSGGDYQFSESVCIASRWDLECRILEKFWEELSVAASAQSPPIVVFRLSAARRFSGTACGFVRFSIEISTWNLEGGVWVSRRPQTPSVMFISVVVALLQISDLVSNWRICIEQGIIKSSPNQDVSLRVY